ncbi:Lrp/AsnC family transcriptional regulator [Amycolatopsis thermoflava]|uniref:Lrp/AsnC family transcriptional regulator n=1 Tax=Amycolatopsis thermoflava TaxID=84480 RepID=UPI0003F5D627|nr:Lrp/AsnC family transcriptional regulator [Amycolatopsis thermoflava]
MQNDVKVGELDRRIVAALQLNGRASWGAVAKYAGTSESTVLRRAAQLTESGQLRVIGVVDVLRCGLGVPVLVRFRCRPGTAGAVAEAIAARPETRYASVLTGSADCTAELVLPTHSDVARLQLDGLPGGGDVLETETLAVMRTFTSNHDWDSGVLGPDAVAGLRGEDVRPFEEQLWERPPEKLDELDLAIIAALGEDGRMSFKELSRQVGSSESTAARRVDSLVKRGCLRFRTLAEPGILGFTVEFMLWLSVLPGHLDAAGQQLAAHPGTRYLSATTGRFNLVGQVVLRHYGELYRHTTDVVGALPGLQAADVTLQVSTLKRAWTPTPRTILEDA